MTKLHASVIAGLGAAGLVLGTASAALAEPEVAAAPVPSCFPDYGSTTYRSGPSDANTYEYLVSAGELPFASGATVYLRINGTTRTETIPRGSNAGSWGPFTSPLGAEVYMSIYQAGEYQVCAGTTGVPGPPAR